MDLRNLFVQNYNMEMVAYDLMDLIDDEVLERFMLDKFGEDFMYGELFDIFSPYLDKETLQILLEDMGHNFVDLDELDEEERSNYY